MDVNHFKDYSRVDPFILQFPTPQFNGEKAYLPLSYCAKKRFEDSRNALEYFNFAKFLIENRADVNKHSYHENKLTALHISCRDAEMTSVKKIKN